MAGQAGRSLVDASQLIMQEEQERLVRNGKLIVVDRQQDHRKFEAMISALLDCLLGPTKAFSEILVEVSLYWLKIIFGGMLQRRRLQGEIRNAKDYEEWLCKVQALEQLNGVSKWKNEGESLDYDYELVQNRLLQFQTAREIRNLSVISFLLRTSMTRNFAGISNPKLYMKSKTGTKQLIDDFNQEIIENLHIMSEGVDDITSHVELKAKADFFRGLRLSLGNTALLLSGGGALGVYHIGVIEAILEAGMLPRIIAGSSAGAIIAAIICTRSEEELPDLIQLKGINYNFMEPHLVHHTLLNDLMRKFRRWFATGHIFDPEHIQRVLREDIGDMTFLEAFSKTKRLLNIAVSSSTSYEMPCLLNYLTAPNVLIWSAVQASCALPMFFPPVQILARNHEGEIVPWQTDTKWIDGSVENDIPMKRLAELFNVNNFIVCQVNPHIYPFVVLSPKEHFFGGLYEKCFTLMMSEIKFRLQQLHNSGWFRKLSYYLLNIVQQPYQGDITIVPRLGFKDYICMFSDLEREGVDRAILRGLHATWPKITMIRSHCEIEMALDEIIVRINAKEKELSGRKGSAESLLDAIEDTRNVLSCTPLAYTSLDELEGVEDLDSLILDTRTLPSFADSIIFNGATANEDEDGLMHVTRKRRAKSTGLE